MADFMFHLPRMSTVLVRRSRGTMRYPCLLRKTYDSPVVVLNQRFCTSLDHSSSASSSSLISRLTAWRAGKDVSDDASNGWVYGYALDGKGGARKLEPWDEEVSSNLLAQQRADSESNDLYGYWVHLDFKRAKNVAWLWHVVVASVGQQGDDEDMGALWLSRLAEEPHVSLPRCEISAENDALYLSFRASMSHLHGKYDHLAPELDVADLRICLTKHLLITARVNQLPNDIQLLPEIQQSLQDGRGGKTCGELAIEILNGATDTTACAAGQGYARILALRANFQKQVLASKGSKPLTRRELAALNQEISCVRYEATRLLRYLATQREAFDTLRSFSQKRKQKIFSKGDAQGCRRALERQDAFVETLTTIGAYAEVLHGEIMAHVSWGTAEDTYRLTLFGGFASFMMIVNICASLLEFSERRGIKSRPSVDASLQRA